MIRFFVFIISAVLMVWPYPGAAQQNEAPQSAVHFSSDKLAGARDFLARIKKGFSSADKQLEDAGLVEKSDRAAGLAEGEELLFNIYVPNSRILLNGALLARVRNEHVVLSFRDFIATLEFPIVLDETASAAEGWYIRENKLFQLDTASRSVKTENGTFTFSDAVLAEDGDLYVPAGELEKWFGFGLEMSISYLRLTLTSDAPLPVEERIARANKKLSGRRRVGPPELPRDGDDGKAIALPVVDVSTVSTYSRDGQNGETRNSHAASVRTAGDFAYGTLTTQSQLDREEKLKSLRFNYKQESLEPELLGPLQARRFELGDVNPPRMALDTSSSSGTGVRITNAAANRSFLRPSTDITGTSFPGWDIELYRANQLLATQTVGDDGIYRFDNVSLFSTDNTYRIVLYGPQGEVREEELYVPVDSSRLAQGGSAYDIALTQQGQATYVKDRSDNEDIGPLNLTALYEKPIGDKTALSLGFETGQAEGERTGTVYSGVSTNLMETLFNLNTAVEHTGEMAAELVARRDVGRHQLRNEISVATEEYGATSTSSQREIFSENFSANGPFPLGIGINPRYDFSLDYAQDTDGVNTIDTGVGFNTAYKRMTFNQQFDYGISDAPNQEDQLQGLTSVSGNIGINRLRASADYEIRPDAHLRRLSGTYQRYLQKDLDVQVGLERQIREKMTEGNARLNWNAGFANISPGLTYNSDNDLSATLNTRFGLAKDPQAGKVKMFDRAISSSGALSAFVFLDENGDGQFNEGERPIPNALIRAPQAGAQEITQDDGYAFFSRLGKMRLTDVFVDPSSLEDPYWIPGYEGASILPREGNIATIQFPVHMSGEIDGTVYGRQSDGTTAPLRSVRLSLYNEAGENVMTTLSELDGFYLFSRIPPGDYYLNIDALVESHYARPAPQRITIGYEGTMLYAQNIYLQEGQTDVPFRILTGGENLTAAPEKLEGRTVVLNLGEYSSRVAMGLSWYKMKTLYRRELAGMDLLDRPSESYADVETNSLTLRVALRGNNIRDAQNRCRALVRHDQKCTVEILPGALPQKMAESAAEEEKG